MKYVRGQPWCLLLTLPEEAESLIRSWLAFAELFLELRSKTEVAPPRPFG